MNLLLDQPIWMLAATLGLIAAIFGWKVLSSIPGSRRSILLSARFLCILCLSLALAGLIRVQDTDRVSVVTLIDTSGSIQGYANFGEDDLGFPIDVRAASLGFVSRSIGERLEDDRLGVIAFDRGASVVLPPRTLTDLQDLDFELQTNQGTDIPNAIQRAISLVSGDSMGRIVLISDGVTTAGDLAGLNSDIPIDVVPIEYIVENEVRIESVEIPTRVRSGSTIPVRVTFQSTAPAQGQLKIIIDGQTVNLTPETDGGGLPLTLKGGQETLTINAPIGSGRVHRVRAIWEPLLDESNQSIGDTSPLNNESTALGLSSENGRALVVSSNPQIETTGLVRVLESTGWTIDPLRPEEVPVDLLGLEPYDLVLMVNTPRDAFMPGIEASLDAYVRTLGGGVVFVGGYEALGAGGWNAPAEQDQELIASLMPLNLDVPDDVVSAHAAVVLVLDSSGSMKRPVMGSSRSQQAVANNSAAGAIEVLDPTDLIGVVSFSSSPKLVVPITKNDDPERIQSGIQSIASGGGTNLAPALRMALEQLETVDASSKHIVVLSDGESENAQRLPALAQEIGATGIKVSTITIGDDADEQSMRQIATSSGGVYYRVVNPAVLPRIFLKAIRVLRKPMIREGRVDPVVLEPSSPMIVDGGITSLPLMTGLVLTDFKADDSRVMVPIVSASGEPILAGHQIELGRVAVFTSDASDWAGGWVDSDSFTRFWTQVSQWAARAEDTGIGELSIDQSGSGLVMGYSAVDDSGVPIDGLSVKTKVYLQDATAQEIQMTQTGPGQYAASVPETQAGDYVLVTTATLNGEPLPPTIGAVHVDDHTEFDAFASDRAALEALASRTGGRVLSFNESADLFSRDGLVEVSSYESLWRTLLVMGFVLFFVDLAGRRIAWDRWVAQARAETIAVSRAVRADQLDALTGRAKTAPERATIDLEPVRRQRPKPKIQQTDDQEVEELGSLMAAKKRARERMDES